MTHQDPHPAPSQPSADLLRNGWKQGGGHSHFEWTRNDRDFYTLDQALEIQDRMQPEDLQEFGPNGRPPPQPISTGAGWLIIYKDGRWIEAYGVDAEYRGNDPDFLIAIPFSSLKAATGSEHGQR